MKYTKRIVDQELEMCLRTFGATVIIGPKWCGKTTTGLQKTKSVLRMQDPDTRDSYIQTANVKPSLLLKGDYPRLIDEWQDAPVLWDAVRLAVDNIGESGLFLLTGSTSIDNTTIKHTGTGRISRLKMYPMSLYESNESNGEISLQKLFDDPYLEIDGIQSELSIEQLIIATCRGGWPGSMNKDINQALRIGKDYLNNICESDISSVDGIRKNPTWTRQLLRSYARNISTLAKKSNIYKDAIANDELMSKDSFETYLNALKKLLVIEDIEAWLPSIRSATAMRSSYKREFVDPSIAVAALGLTPAQLEMDLKTFGFIFECLCIRDLKIYSQALGGRVSYYHDRYGLEADVVLHLDNGKYALIECKLGSKEIDDGAKHLLKIVTLIKEANEKEKQTPLRLPDVLMILTGGNMAYTRSDGVKVIPIGCLKN